MLRADSYNARITITAEQVTTLVRDWQHNHELEADGMLGPKTLASIQGHRLSAELMDRALTLARKDLGRGETTGNNRGQWLDIVRSQDGTGLPWKGYKAPWCASVLSHWYTRAEKQVGSKGLIPWRSSRHARTLGKWLAANAYTCEVPLPGAIGIYKRGLPGSGKGHAVIFEEYDPQADSAITIEGNVGKFPAKVKRIVYLNGSWRKKLIGVYSF